MIEAAIVGLGRWGQAIVNAVQGKSARLKFVRGVCKEPEAMRGFAAAHGLALSVELDEAIADPRVRAIVLATPHSLHVEQIIAVAKAGKAVWSEKPLALVRAEAERAVEACRRAGVVLGLGNSKRCFPSMLELARLVAGGTLGDVLHVEGHFSNEHSTRVKGGWRDDPRESPGGGMTGRGCTCSTRSSISPGPLRASTRGCSRANRRPTRATWPRCWSNSRAAPLA